jgi:hypothetical protein
VERLNNSLGLMAKTIAEQLNTIQTQLSTLLYYQTMISSTTSSEKSSTVALPKIHTTAELSSDLCAPEDKLRDAAATPELHFDWDQMLQNYLALEVDLVSGFPLDEGLQA